MELGSGNPQQSRQDLPGGACGRGQRVLLREPCIGGEVQISRKYARLALRDLRQ